MQRTGVRAFRYRSGLDRSQLQTQKLRSSRLGPSDGKYDAHRVSAPYQDSVKDMPSVIPVEPNFAALANAASYDAWFRAKVEKAMTSTEPGIPHDQVIAMVQEIIEQHRPR